MLIAKDPLLRKASRLEARRSMLHSTSGGSSETELKELIVRPTGAAAASRVVTTATPVAKRDITRRNSCRSTPPGGGATAAAAAGHRFFSALDMMAGS
jgi:phage tail tape-measure protein